MKKKVAVVLFNLGAPEKLSDVRSFLFSLFYDKNIINIINPFRFLIAKLIASYREKSTIKIYRRLANEKSPLLEETNLQAAALEKYLNFNQENSIYKVFICMRYTNPCAKTIIQSVANFLPNKVILLPLYPHYSSTTTLSSIKDWHYHAKKYKFPTSIICCYYNNSYYIKAYCQIIYTEYTKALKIHNTPRILFSAHSLPISIVNKGDPYHKQIHYSASMIVKALNIKTLDWVICYQSKIGYVKWLEPCTKSEILRAQQDNVPVIIVPISFVSENSETLFELDIYYKSLLSKKLYFRVPTLGINKLFIKCLKDLCIKSQLHCNLTLQCSYNNKMCWHNTKKLFQH
ncbi:ferrochelatase [Neoehrlichia mikurensis]|uniref:Ferrochelatase n=1 Tax=Neoehrlichia mikurensis TaxID=89586 RepID=A0A9Q9C0A4_9RICK|nr:ferrochelatase [Neoehrlichia mikurensis]QXK91780.1 ferrochelatase [Neoehrlichia mikurensis]QXK92993.1 ferrochelatase [Neoehrlichia mikurensis]QXK93470.1 ferrochelatase [Neoehrlichia mikurensis]UTO55575.1 ferrochelatase [Neoehrlichia mikurensis]UTO56496.1 ferrochelatase [Neoehrlichia mikurensis]